MEMVMNEENLCNCDISHYCVFHHRSWWNVAPKEEWILEKSKSEVLRELRTALMG